MERTAQNDLIAVLRLINAGKVSVSDKTRYPTAATKRDCLSLLAVTTDPPPEETVLGNSSARFELCLPLIVQAAGLAELATGLNSKTGQKLSSPRKPLKTAWNKWLKTTAR